MTSALRPAPTRQLGLFALLLIAIVVCACLAPRDAVEEPDFRFVFMADIHLCPEHGAVDGYRAALESVRSRHPDFVLTGGDLVMDALAAPFERADRLYNLFGKETAALSAPFYHTIGNHEVFGVYEKSGVSPDHPEFGKEMFRRRLGGGRTYRAFDHGGWHFVIIDSIGITEEGRYVGEVDAAQMDWIRDDLSGVSPDTPIVLATHIPLVSVSPQFRNGPRKAVPPHVLVGNANDVLALFERHDLRLVLQGHLHVVEEITFRGVTFVTGGAVCGRWWEGPNSGFEEGYVVVDVKDGDFTWEYVDYGWEAAAGGTG